MNSSKLHSLSRNTTALLRVLSSLEDKLAKKQLTYSNIWLLLLENLSKFKIEGEVVMFSGDKQQPIYFALESPKGYRPNHIFPFGICWEIQRCAGSASQNID
ncbi:MAG: hypothetical protein B6243_10355 [Anaerolineaceae bacterium 4572_5.2]|nr:MAG: hypothetical protein B6243_10355 [Anaerolineaceae bacterium 4572_5.2]